jgi:hypothetical protein
MLHENLNHISDVAPKIWLEFCNNSNRNGTIYSFSSSSFALD